MTRKFKKQTAILSSAVISLSMLSYLPNNTISFSNEPVSVSAAVSISRTYTVCGDSILCGGEDWNEESTQNLMTLNEEDDVYQKIYHIGKHENLRFGVIQTTYTGSTTSKTFIGCVDDFQGDKYNSFTFNSTKEDSEVIISYKPSTGVVSITGDVEIPKFAPEESITIVGEPELVNGVNWDPSAESTKMIEVEDNLYEIVLRGVNKYDGYQFQFVADENWTYQWGLNALIVDDDDLYLKSGVETDISYRNIKNCLINIPFDNATVKVQLDFRNCDANTKSGAKVTATITPPYREDDINNDGKDEVVYQISNKEQLKWFADYVNSGHSDVNAELMGDINLENSESDTWTPIKDYNGTFDGNGYKISNIYAKVDKSEGFFSDSDHGGFFANTLSDAIVKNLGISGHSKGNLLIGGIVGKNRGKIENCYMQGTIEATEVYAGGISAYNYGTIINCYNESKINSSSYLSGITVCNYGAIINCYNEGEINGSSFLGGIAEENHGTITNCYNKGKINATSRAVGGLVCEQRGENASISNCYNVGIVNASESVGGLVYKLDSDDSSISNCYYLEGCNGENTTFDTFHGTEKSLKSFNNGEVAYLLANGDANSKWGQSLSGEEIDDYPTLNGTTVYENKNYCPFYTNNPKNDKWHENDYVYYGYCRDCGEMYDIGSHHEGYTVSLNGNICLNYYMELSEDIIDNDDTYVEFTFPDGTVRKVYKDENLKNTTIEPGRTYYIFPCEISSTQMRENIAAQLFSGGKSARITMYFHLDSYANYIISHHPEKFTQEDIRLAKALLNFGANSQLYFKENTDDLANYLLDNDDRDFSILDSSSLEQYKSHTQKSQLGKFVGFDLMLKSETTLNLYFEPAENVDIDSIKFMVDGNIVSPTPYKNYYCISIENIKAQNLDKIFNVLAVSNEDDSVFSSISCSAMSYCYNVLRDYGKTYSNELKSTVSALRTFNEAAKAKFEATNGSEVLS